MKLSNSFLGPVLAAMTACGGPEPKPLDDYTFSGPAVKAQCLGALDTGITTFNALASRARQIQVDPYAEMTIADRAQLAVVRTLIADSCSEFLVSDPKIKAKIAQLKGAANAAKPELEKAKQVVMRRRAKVAAEEAKPR